MRGIFVSEKFLKSNTGNTYYASVISLICMILMISNPEAIMNSAKNALVMCFTALLPALFPFMVASSVFVNSADQKFFSIAEPAMQFLFGISAAGAAALIPGILCGYPVGAGCTCKLYEKKQISKSEAESLIAFSNNSGPLFVIGSVGCGILGNLRQGIYLYAIHILCAVICGIILKPYTVQTVKAIKTEKSEKRTVSFVDAVCDSTAAVLKVCGFVVIFAVINAVIMPLIKIFPPIIKCFAAAFLELTNAVGTANRQINSSILKLAVISGAMGWSGLSVHMQVKSIVKTHNLSMKKYYFIKIVAAIISMLLAYLFFGNLLRTDIQSSLIILSCIFLLAAMTLIIRNTVKSLFYRKRKYKTKNAV